MTDSKRDAEVTSSLPNRDQRSWHTGPWLAVALGILFLLPGLANNFTYDDVKIVKKNPRVQSLSAIPKIWTTDWWLPTEDLESVGSQGRDRLYRPLTMTTFALNHAACGLNPMGFQVVNLALHALACFLLWHLAYRLTKNRPIAAVAAVLFAIHPVHIEAVSNIVGRAEVLSAVLMMSAILTLLPKQGTAKFGRVLLASVLFFASMTAKESAICYFPIAILLLLAHRWLEADRPKRHMAQWITAVFVLALPAAVYLTLRYFALEGHLKRIGSQPFLMNPYVFADTIERVIGALTIFGFYIRLFVYPVNLSCDYSYPLFEPTHSPTAMTLVGLVGVIAVIVGLFGFLSKNRTWRLIAVFTAVGVLSYGLISNTLLLIGVTVAERLMYWPSVPALILFAILGVSIVNHITQSGKKPSRLIPIAFAALVFALGARSMVRTLEWQSNMVLFTTDVETYPRSAKLQKMAGDAKVLLYRKYMAMANRSDSPTTRQKSVDAAIANLEQAKGHLDAALQMMPKYADALNSRGFVARYESEIQKSMGNTKAADQKREEANRYFDAAQMLDQTTRTVSEAAALSNDELRSIVDDLDSLDAALETSPNDPKLLLQRSKIHLRMRNFTKAWHDIEKAYEQLPSDTDTMQQYWRVAITVKRDEEAVRVMKELVERDPEDWETMTTLAVTIRWKSPQKALEYAKNAYELAPDKVVTATNLAGVYAFTGDTEAALRLYRMIHSGLPDGDPMKTVIIDTMNELKKDTKRR